MDDVRKIMVLTNGDRELAKQLLELPKSSVWIIHQLSAGVAPEHLLKSVGESQQVSVESWIRVPCTNHACRGRRCGNRTGFLTPIKESRLQEYHDGKYKPECNECFSR